jgi:hypothetical protein
VTVGIIAVSNADYNPKQWWRYSDGVREVIGESIAYIYAKFLFYPSVSLSDKEPAQGLRHLVDLLGTWDVELVRFASKRFEPTVARLQGSRGHD